MTEDTTQGGDDEIVDLAESRDTSRLEAFSDGIFSVAITLLVLNIKIPPPNDRSLVHDLLAQWPEYVACIYSFVQIGIYWMNHHYIFKYIRKVDQFLLFLNVLSLFCIVLMPFGAGLLAEYIGGDRELARDAAFLFNGIGFVCGVQFAFLWRYAARHKQLLVPGLSDEIIRSLSRDYNLGIIMCAIALALVFVNVPLSLISTMAIGMFFARPARMRSASRLAQNRALKQGDNT